VLADVLIDVVTAVMVDIGVDMVGDVVEVIILAVTAIALEFAASLSYTVDMLAGAAMEVDVLIACLEFTVSASFEGEKLFF